MTTIENRQSIHRMAEQGLKSQEIAHHLGLGLSVVKKWRTRLKKNKNVKSFMGRPPRGALSSFSPHIAEQLRRWRTKYPFWGGQTLLTELKLTARFMDLKLPSRSVIARFLKEEGFIKKPYVKRSTKDDVDKVAAVEKAHQRWQMDAMGNNKVEIGGDLDQKEVPIGMINLKDVHTNICTGSFPVQYAKMTSSPTGNDYRMALRLGFCEHGIPEQIQCDHAGVFYNNQVEQPFPTLFHLWLVGLDIQIVFSRVRTPTDQAQIERQHRTTWMQNDQKDGFDSWKQYFDHIQKRRWVLNQFFPSTSLKDRPPLEVFPDDEHSGRDYRPELENQLFDLLRVDRFLSGKSWTRKVSSNGTIKLSKQAYFIEKKYAGQKLIVTFDDFRRDFQFTSIDGVVLKTHPAKGLSQQRIVGDAPIMVPSGFQLQFPFNATVETELRLYETPKVTSL